MRGIGAWWLTAVIVSFIALQSESAPAKAFRRDPGHPTWHHGAFHDVRDSVRSDVRRMLHSRAEVPFQVPLEVNVVLIGFNGDGGYRYSVDSQKLEEFLRVSFPSHRPACLETGEPLDIEHHIVYNTFPAGQPEVIELEKNMKAAMVPAGSAREADFGREVPAFDVDATTVEPVFEKLYSYIFDMESGRYSGEEMDRPVPNAIFIVNFDKVRMDPRNKDIDLDNLMYGKIPQLTEDEMKKQDGDYIYRYRYNGGGASQIWLSSGRFVVIDLSAGPCTYGKIETEEGSVSSKTLPRLRNVVFPRGFGSASDPAHAVFIGQLSALVATTIEHVIAPDVRFETVDTTTRLLIPIIVLQNHNRYNILDKGHNNSIDVEAIEAEIKKMVHSGQDVVMVGGLHALHRHEKLAIAVSKAMRSRSLHETKNDGRFHVRTKIYLDGAILKEEMERSADMLAAGLLEVSDPSLSSKYFLRQNWVDESDDSSDSLLKHKPIWATYASKRGKDMKKRMQKKQGDMHRTYGTRVVPVFVLSLAVVDPQLMMEEESLVWTSNERNAIYARVDMALRRIRETSEIVQTFAGQYLKTPLGEPVKGKKNKTSTELWLEKFYKKTTNLPEPFPHELVERLEKYLDGLEEQLVDLLLYDHRLQDAKHEQH